MSHITCCLSLIYGGRRRTAAGGSSGKQILSPAFGEASMSLVTFHFSLNVSAGGLSTNGANRKIGRPGGVAMCDKTNQTVGVR
ncbi:MAG: hypothetical protein ACKOGP_07360, partial [Bacteroidota bacterium]